MRRTKEPNGADHDDQGSVRLTFEMIEILLAEKARTKLGAKALFAKCADVPHGLTLNMLVSWFTGGIKFVRRPHYDYILRAYRHLPDNHAPKKRPLKADQDRLTLDDDMRLQLRLAHTRAPANYLDAAPGGFSAQTMAYVLSGRNKTIPKTAWEFVMKFADGEGGNSETLPPRD